MQVHANATAGISGLWLQDPYNYTLQSPEVGIIETSLNGGTSVAISTQQKNTPLGSTADDIYAGNININAPITKSGGGDASLSFQADGDILIGASIDSTSGKLDVTAKARGQIILEQGESIDTSGGDIVLWSNAGRFDLGSGEFVAPVDSGPGEHYIRLNSGSSLNSSGGKIVLAGGLDDNSDGYPDGYAYIGTAIDPPNSTGGFAGEPKQPGVSPGNVRDQNGALISIQSGGGDIIIRGRRVSFR